MFRRALFPLLVFFGGLLATPAAVVEDLGAETTVNDFHEILIDVMRDSDTLGFSGRRARLDPVVRQHFDLGFISRVVTGRFWKSMDESQQSQMLDTFSELTVVTYASRFDGYSGQAFKTVETRPLKKERVLVRSLLVSPDGDVVQLDYVLHRPHDEWRIINVIADGVSDLSIKRADYSSVIKQSGFAGLLVRLNEQIDNYSRNS